MKTLFRPESAAPADPNWLGVIRLANPLSVRLLSCVLGAVTIGTFLFLGNAHYTRTQHATGILIPAGGLLQIAAPVSGIVADIDVVQGQPIVAGASLLNISTERYGRAAEGTVAEVTAQLRLERAKVASDIDSLKALAAERRSILSEKGRSLHGQLDQMDAQLAVQTQRAAGAHAMFDKMRPLISSGVVSGVQGRQQENEALDADSRMRELQRQRLQLLQELADQRTDLQEQPLLMSGERHDRERKLAELDEAIAQNEQLRESVVRAPQTGLISSVSVKLGQYVQAGQPMMSIVPKGSPLIAQVLLPSSAIGFVHVGSLVVLHYRPYSYQKFGLARGVVLSVTYSAPAVSRASAALEAEVPEPMYEIDVRLSRQTLDVYGQTVALQPGMTVEAAVPTETRSLLEWAFEPLYDLSLRARSNLLQGS